VISLPPALDAKSDRRPHRAPCCSLSQLARAEESATQALDETAADVLDDDWKDDIRRPELAECPFHRCGHRFTAVAAAVRRFLDPDADLGLGSADVM
jgi:hypothetical protein